MSRKIIETEGPGLVASSARKYGLAVIGIALVVLVLFLVLSKDGHAVPHG
jgi:hypothetical protein